eukprot:TRINITY_DN2160_c0_g1_i5.p1 TRINITY_DN2160_c0_g1~~TRINITY_DN2160_c0_g1_i5.p1  ORF type:complete len:232 (-),score=29.15 TRINITY_DN2160_c0_g1_i5:72-767(-)
MKMMLRHELMSNIEFPLSPGSKALSFVYAGEVFNTKSGLKAGNSTTNYLRSDAFKNRPKNQVQQKGSVPVSPDEVILGRNIRESMYCHVLCALKRYREVESITSQFLFGVAEGFRLLEELWNELVEDLRAGTVSRKRVVDPTIREAMDKFLNGPDLEVASKVEEECGKVQWDGIVHRLWPNARYVKGVATGAMKPYVPLVLRFLGPDLPLVSLLCHTSTTSFFPRATTPVW